MRQLFGYNKGLDYGGKIQTMSQDYNATLNLPKTEFPMRAGLPKREPGMLEEWYKKDIYGKLIEKNKKKPLFVVHDGPPFSNGHIHMGTSMNKVLKDFIVRYRNMAGYYSPFTPGWDNHGMPIESAIIKKNKLDRKKMSVSEFRDACRDFAADFVEIQKKQFMRLGVLGDWEHPYLTMDPEYEALEVKVFGAMYEKGYIYKGLKPVYWCTHDETSLAEAEIEYEDDKCHSIYVKFKLIDDNGKLSSICNPEKTYFIIWTTTPWTLPGNLAISLNGDFEYALVKEPSGDVYIIAEELVEPVAEAAGLDSYEIIGKLPGTEFELMTAKHPLYDRQSVILLGDHVTLDAGTGCVHTAPGHGMEDFTVCRAYDDSGKTNIGVIVPVDSRGIMTEEAGKFAGMYYSKANQAILDELEGVNALLASEVIAHQYPHCWRCKEPIIYRATDQWFCSVDAFKEAAVEACENVTWMPEWGKERITNMIKNRADWCISRQRHWGLPIPVFYCSTCGNPVCNSETIEIVSELFGKKGSNAWYDMKANEILPPTFKCPHCGANDEFTQETDTLDCWFDSGSSHIASLERNNKNHWPADLYLEGSDQYRGWFQSSLLTSVAVKGRAPYRAVLSHGWTLDGEGKAMHKSLGNVIPPEDLINKYGADLLRLWVASSDYRADVRVSDKIFKQLSDIYLKIRNTARFILGNLYGFDPDSQIEFEDMPELDKWALVRLNGLIEKVRNAYEKYEFHLIYHAIHNFCAVDMSSFYLDIIKDRLYCEEKDDPSRRSAQTVMYRILDSMVRMLAPILSFTAEEIWQAMPHHKGVDTDSVMFNPMPETRAEYVFDEKAALRWERLLKLRDDVNKALELARTEKLVGKSLDADITLYFKDAGILEELSRFDLRKLFIVSKVTMTVGEGEGHRGEFENVVVSVRPSQAKKCARCWTHDENVGSDTGHSELCPRCTQVVKRIQ
jgi:isoleucyl-tRNA synthetase